ncbi:MAG: transketolase [Actinomycetota bacterium]|nr:transketolase [Actinomycetota bacterium]
MKANSELDNLCINTIRALTIDAVEKAKSGHPGAPMGLAPVGYTLWTRFLRHNPRNPNWAGRDRFILSAGHASMLLYSLLYLSGYDLSLDDIKRFRQLGSKTPGHPEYGITPGVEVTTGPLGQGISNAVGMALARKLLAVRFNKPGFDLTDYFIYVIASDGDMMEGVTSEACSLAGHLRLDHLICLYDDNQITIEGPTSLAFSEDVGGRFKAYGWHVSFINDANDIDQLSEKIGDARKEKRPALIIVRSRIACGSPNMEGREESHGAPLGEHEVISTKENLGISKEEFHVPKEVLENMRKAIQIGEREEKTWNEKFRKYEREYPDDARTFRRILNGKLPDGWDSKLPSFESDKSIATRDASGKILEAVASVLPEIVGGSADLGTSVKTYIKGWGNINSNDFSGRNLHFGVREHAMGAILNGMARHGGFIPYGGTFLVFSDYMRPALRMAALMKLHVIYVFSHDSLGVGEDGPTHQPVEQLASLRTIPGLIVIRPADANETVEAWKVALRENRPVALILSRQKLPVFEKSSLSGPEGLFRGAYILSESKSKPAVALIASGSEVSLALEAGRILEKEDIPTRVISMPSWELFDEQDEEYRKSVLPDELKARVSVEAGSPFGWCKYTGENGKALGIEGFGFSAPGDIALREAGFTAERIIAVAKSLI